MSENTIYNPTNPEIVQVNKGPMKGVYIRNQPIDAHGSIKAMELIEGRRRHLQYGAIEKMGINPNYWSTPTLPERYGPLRIATDQEWVKVLLLVEAGHAERIS